MNESTIIIKQSKKTIFKNVVWFTIAIILLFGIFILYYVLLYVMKSGLGDLVSNLESHVLHHNLSSNGGVKFNSIAGHFQIEFPTYPSMTTGTNPGESNAQEYIYKYSYSKYVSSFKGDYYDVIYANYPNNEDLSDTQKFLEGTINGTLISEKGTLLSSKFINYNNYPAAEFIFRINEQSQTFYFKTKDILVDHTLYSIIIMSSSNNFSNFDKFANSFQLTGQ